ncbi:hypothetical protein IT396_00420 [Candidatus Nomurabacteria bacterium]|nr:hypothetical protein [Candidatus Nomurabacteria bacterium]
MFSPLNIRIGFYLALRHIKRASIWTTSLIVFVMLLTFLNLVVVTGILVGLVAGINSAYQTHYIGDVIISPLEGEDYIKQSPSILALLDTLPQVTGRTTRYLTSGTLEAGYKSYVGTGQNPNFVSLQVAGIDPSAEDAFTSLGGMILSGAYLDQNDYDQVLIGSQRLAQYSAFAGGGGGLLTVLEDVDVGSVLRLRIGDVEREVTVKGIIDSKLDELSLRLYMPATQLRGLIGRNDYNLSEIAMRLTPGTDPIVFKDLLVRSGVSDYGVVETFEESIPDGVQEITNTFAMLGNMISSVGLVVASITIFIVIFINALTRRKFIGILKGIGIDGKAIEISYMFQSLFYAAIGSGIGLAVLYGFLVPFVAAHPIDFPFSDGILVAPIPDTMVRVALLVVATVIAGYIPARMIVKKNTLDSILGRN